MRKRSIPGSTWTTRSGSRHSRMQPASVSDRPSRRSASRNKTRPPSDEISPPPKSAVTFLRLTAGRSNGSRLSSVMAAWRFRCLGRRTLDNDFLPNTNDLRHVRHHIVAPQRIKRASSDATLAVHASRRRGPLADGTPSATALRMSPFSCQGDRSRMHGSVTFRSRQSCPGQPRRR